MSKPEIGKDEKIGDYVKRLEAWGLTPEGAAHASLALRLQEEARRDEDARWLRDQACVPRSVLEILVKEVRATEPMEVARQNQACKLLVLAGKAGAGKTVAACWLVAQPKTKTALFVKAAQLARWQRYDEDEVDRLIDPGLLVIDDLGAEFNDERGSFLTLLDEVLVRRLEEKRRTVVTTNLDAGEWEARYGIRILDRIRESGVFYQFGGPSLRGRAL